MQLRRRSSRREECRRDAYDKWGQEEGLEAHSKCPSALQLHVSTHIQMYVCTSTMISPYTPTCVNLTTKLHKFAVYKKVSMYNYRPRLDCVVVRDEKARPLCVAGTLFVVPITCDEVA